MARLDPAELAKIRELADGCSDPVERARAIKRGMEHWTVLLHETVRQAREQNVAWERIADALGVSRQAVSKRFRVDVVGVQEGDPDEGDGATA